MRRAMTNGRQIVIAWTEMTGLRPTGKMVRFDGYNYRPEFEACPEAKAAMWLVCGSKEDVVRAEFHVRELAEDGRVFTYPTTEKDPLGKARRAMLAAVR